MSGFSTIELVSAISVVSTLTAIAAIGYNWYIPKSQAAEPIQLMQISVMEVNEALKKGQCTLDGQPKVINAKYGTLTIDGTVIKASGSTCSSGCTMSYKFTDEATRVLEGEIIVANVLNNAKLSKNTSTTLAEKYLPDSFGVIPVNAGHSCGVPTHTTPLSTKGGGVSGVEVGEVEPTPPTPPTPPTSGSESGSGSGSESGSGSSSGSGPGVVETVIHINATYAGTSQMDSGYYIKNTVSVYDAAVAKLGRAPTTNDVIKFVVSDNVAVVGNTTLMGAFDFDQRLPSGGLIKIENHGYISGRGGNGGQGGYGATNVTYGVGDRGGHAFSANRNTSEIQITNIGTIAGGGGGGFGISDSESGQDAGSYSIWGGGGAPFGLNDPNTRPRTASLLQSLRTFEEGRGGAIGMPAEPIPRSASGNRGQYAKAGCLIPPLVKNIKIKGGTFLQDASCAVPAIF